MANHKARNALNILSDCSSTTKEFENDDNGDDNESPDNYTIPKNVEVFEITDPLFFGAAYKFKEAMRFIENPPKVLIIRMRKVPIIDATGIKTINEVYKESKQKGMKLILSEVYSQQIVKERKDARLLFSIGKANVTDTFEEAIDRSKEILIDL